MVTELTDDDAGPTVRTPNDSTGRVTRVEDGVAYVEPDSEAPETVLAALGWDDAGAEAEDGSESGDGAGDRLPRTAIDEGEGGEITLLRDDADADRSASADHDPDAALARASDDRSARAPSPFCATARAGRTSPR